MKRWSTGMKWGDNVVEGECYALRSWLLSLLLEQGQKTDSRHFDDLVSNTRNITLCLSLSSETTDENFIVFIYRHKTVSFLVTEGLSEML